MRLLKNRRGSTLAMVLVVISVLSLLGTAILSLTLMGFKIKAIDAKQKIAFYISEAGLDQAYAIIGKDIQEAIDYSRNIYTPDEMDKFIDGTLAIDGINGERTKQNEDRNSPLKNYTSKYKSPYFYQRYFIDTEDPANVYDASGNLIEAYLHGSLYRTYTYDSNNNLIGEFDVTGKEIAAKVAKLDDAMQLVLIDETDDNAQIDGMITYRIKEKIKDFYAKGYVKYITDNTIVENDNENLKDKLVKLVTYQNDIEYQSGKESILSVAVKPGTDFDLLKVDIDGNLDVSQKMVIPFESATQVRNLDGTLGTEKRLGTTFTIGIPDYDTPYLISSEIMKLKRNVLWEKTLTTDSDIIVTGKNVVVNGDVYAAGTKPLNESNYLMYGGIVVGDAYSHPLAAGMTQSDREGNITINGTAATAGYLETRNSNSNITVNGDVYCNSLVTQYGDDTTNFLSNKINLLKDLNTLDDIEMNSSKSLIDIEGNYFGYSIGESSTTTNNQSSSIVINSEDIGLADGSQLILKGEGDDKVYNTDSGDIVMPKGTYIAGSVYIDYGLKISALDNPDHGTLLISQDGPWSYKPDAGYTGPDSFVLQITNVFGGVRTEEHSYDIAVADSGTIEASYQTGDSVSVVGNYFAYSMVLTGIDADGNPIDMDPKFVNIAEENFEYIPPLVLVKRFNDGTPLGFYDKAKYAQYAKDEYSSIFNFGGSGIQVGNVRFSLGNYINLNTMLPNIPVTPAYLEGFTYKSYDYRYQTNKMADPQLDNYMTDPAGAELDSSASISDFFKFDASAENSLSTGGDIPLEYTNASADKALFIKGTEDGVHPVQDANWISDKDTITLTDKNLKGIIVTKGDVYLSGSINFTGTIAAEGNIYILDDNPKTFTNDFNASMLTSYNNFVIKTVYNDLKTTGTQLGDLFEQKDEWLKEIIFVYQASAGTVQVDETQPEITHYKRLSDLVKISLWTKYR